MSKSPDKKPWDKPNSEFKKLRRRQRRAKMKQALKNNKELPVEKKNDIWDWN